MFREIVLLGGLLLSVTAADDAAAVNIASLVSCSNTDSMISGMQKCLDLYDVPLTLPSGDQLNNVSSSTAAILQQIDKNTTVTLCKEANRENYIKSMMCVLDISKKCAGGSSPVLDALLSSPEKIRKQIEFQCQTLADFNQDCVVANTPSIQKCMNISGIVDDLSAGEDFATRITCVSMALTRTCARKHLASCGDATLQVYERQLPDLSEICSNYTGSIHVVTNRTTNDCSLESVRQNYISCQYNAEIFLLLPQSLDSNEKLAKHILRTIMLKHSQRMCSSKLPQYEDLINCTLSVQRQCSATDSLKQLVPDTKSVQDGFRQLCLNISDFNSTCVSQFNDNNVTSQTESHPRPADCNKLREDHKKQRDAFTGCGDLTVTLYQHVLSSQLPIACRNTDTTVTSTDSSGYKPTLSFFLVFISSVLLH